MVSTILTSPEQLITPAQTWQLYQKIGSLALGLGSKNAFIPLAHLPSEVAQRFPPITDVLTHFKVEASTYTPTPPKGMPLKEAQLLTFQRFAPTDRPNFTHIRWSITYMLRYYDGDPPDPFLSITPSIAGIRTHRPIPILDGTEKGATDKSSMSSIMADLGEHWRRQRPPIPKDTPGSKNNPIPPVNPIEAGQLLSLISQMIEYRYDSDK